MTNTLTRPIAGIENRTAQEVFDIMCDRIRLSASPAGPFEMRHDEGGYIEFLNEEVPTVVREIDGRVAILTTLEQPRKVVGYRVYDPGSSPSEIFGSATTAGVVKPLEWKLSWGPDEDGDECHVASTPFGSLAVERLDGRWKWRYCFDEYYDEDKFECDDLEAGKVAAQAMWNSRISPLIDARILSAIEPAGPQCCMCGKKGLSTVEGDGGTECELTDGRWVCSAECWDRAIEPAGVGVETYKLAAWMVRENDRDHWEFVRLKLVADNLVAKGYEVVPLYSRAALKGDEQ